MKTFKALVLPIALLAAVASAQLFDYNDMFKEYQVANFSRTRGKPNLHETPKSGQSEGNYNITNFCRVCWQRL